MQEVAKSQGISYTYAIDNNVMMNDVRIRRKQRRAAYANGVFEMHMLSEYSTAKVAHVITDVPASIIVGLEHNWHTSAYALATSITLALCGSIRRGDISAFV